MTKRHDPTRAVHTTAHLCGVALLCSLLLGVGGACGGSQAATSASSPTSPTSPASPGSPASPTSPVGLWKTVDESGEAKSMVRIWTENERLYGKIETLLGGVDPNVQCIKCKGEKRNAPVIGMVILEGLRQNGTEWSGGSILDPKSGKTYKCRVEVHDQGTRLEVRGYVGFSLLGRTQHWYRVE